MTHLTITLLGRPCISGSREEIVCIDVATWQMALSRLFPRHVTPQAWSVPVSAT
jgi:hypothetical protein